MKPAVFLDRDGTLIEDRGHLRSPAQVVFFPDTVPALKRLQPRFALFIVTHQPGIASGLVQAAEVDSVNAHVVAELRRQGVAIEAVYCCPHKREEGCACIKPRPHFPELAARRFGLDLAGSFTVGDHPHDVDLGRNMGGTGIYVLTGHGAKHRAEMAGCHAVVPGIREAADWILACRTMREQEEAHPGLLDAAAKRLREGGVVAFPTETVYGLGAAAFNETAAARIFEIKRRPRFDPLIVHVSRLEQLAELASAVPPEVRALVEHFWPGPLTVVLPKAPRVPDLVTSGLPTVAVRMPRHPLALELIDRAGTPVAAPSANPFGRTSPTTADHVRDQLAGEPDFILDGGPCAVGVESTIVSFAEGKPVLLRPGGLPAEELEALIGPLARAGAGKRSVLAPGMLPSHYAPHAPLRLVRTDADFRPEPGRRTGVLAFRQAPEAPGFAAVEVLAPDGDLRDAAAHLFGALRRLDAAGVEVILARLVPAHGLGLAINDRLRRAAGLEKDPE